jgi:hypothetical protein
LNPFFPLNLEANLLGAAVARALATPVAILLKIPATAITEQEPDFESEQCRCSSTNYMLCRQT